MDGMVDMTDKDISKMVADEMPFIQQRPQSQRSLLDQLLILMALANRMGLYDAADFIRDKLDINRENE